MNEIISERQYTKYLVHYCHVWGYTDSFLAASAASEGLAAASEALPAASEVFPATSEALSAASETLPDPSDTIKRPYCV